MSHDINVNHRFAAYATTQRLRAEGNHRLAALIEYATHAEARPHSYTDEAVGIAQETIVAAAADDKAELVRLGTAIAAMQQADTWMVPLS